jgi:hypothetical protein
LKIFFLGEHLSKLIPLTLIVGGIESDLIFISVEKKFDPFINEDSLGLVNEYTGEFLF